jgi:hypothetical protein
MRIDRDDLDICEPPRWHPSGPDRRSAASRPSNTSMIRPGATSTTAVTSRRRRRRRAEAITVSSNPIISTRPASPGSAIRPRASSSIAAHTVDHATPNRRASDAGAAPDKTRPACATAPAPPGTVSKASPYLALLTGARFTIDTHADDRVDADEVAVETVTFGPLSAAVGVLPQEVRLLTGSDATILAVIREEPADPVGDETGELCRAGDRVVVAARQDTRSTAPSSGTARSRATSCCRWARATRTSRPRKGTASSRWGSPCPSCTRRR